MVSDPTCSDGGADAPAGPRRLVLAPFRAVRYDGGRVGDLADVLAPPYDVIGEDAVRRLETHSPYNVVRLTRPDADDPGAGRYARAAQLLRTWLQEGILVRDELPALYVHEHLRDGRRYRALLGALALDSAESGAVVPHERVMPAPVADRLALLEATRCHLEPILLTTPDTGEARAVVARAVATAPVLDVATGASRHRVWAVTDPAEQALVATALADRVALVADGHHRWTASLAHRDRLRRLDTATGTHELGFAALVDAGEDPLDLDAIHRAVAGLRLDDAVAALPDGVEVTSLRAEERPSALERLDDPDGPMRLVLVAGDRWVEVVDRDGVLARRLPHDVPDAWRSLDNAALHEVVLPLWGVAGEDRISYAHEVDDAVQDAERADGVAVLTRPVSLPVVMELATAGVRMPRKTTSFAPKPPTGLLMRDLLD